MVENTTGIASTVDPVACDNNDSVGSTNKLMPYCLTEQFRIKVQKENKPSVRFYFVLFIDLFRTE